MVPAEIVVLDEFPLTSSGKIDRKALLAPVVAAAPFRAPQTPTEKIVAEVFAEVLGLDRVGLDDDFFALGGDSLIATRVSARLHLALGREVPVRYLFEASTVGDLADYLHRHRGDSDTTDCARSSSGSDPEEGYWRAAVLHSSFGWGELAVPGSW